MGKYLLSILIIILASFFFCHKIHAEAVHEIGEIIVESIDDYKQIVVKADISQTKATGNTAETYTLQLDVPDLTRYFVSADVDGVATSCSRNYGSINCAGKGSIITYRFNVIPSQAIENKYCQYVTAEKQNTDSTAKKYIQSFVGKINSSYSNIHKIVISGVTIDGKLSEIYADVSSSFAISALFTTNSLVEENSVDNLIFSDNPKAPKATNKKSIQAGEYTPIYGRLESMGGSTEVQTYFVATKSNSLNVNDVTYILCDRTNLHLATTKSTLSHSIFDEERLISKSGERYLYVTYENVSNELENEMQEVQPTPTQILLPTNTPAIRQGGPVSPTATPTTNIIASTNSATNTPSPINVEQSLESKADSTSSQTNPSVAPTNTIPKYDDKKETELQSEKPGEEKDILGETTNRAESNQNNVISTPTGDEPVGWRDPLFQYVNNTTIRIIFITILVFLVATYFLILFLRVIKVFSATRDLFQHKADRYDKKSSLIAKLFNKVSKFVGIFVVIMIVFARPVAAQSAYTSIKITDAFTMHGTGAYTGVMNVIYTYVTKSSTLGKYVISSNPDGTGDIKIGNYLQAIVKNVYYASSKSYYVGPADGSGKHYICPDDTTLPPQDVSSWLPTNGATYQITFRFITSCQKDFPVSDLYLVFVPDPTPTPSATPTNTMTPTPTPFAPFLDLPWDYKSKGLSFSSAATAMTSYFDHEYPLLSASVVGLSDSDDLTLIYEGIKDDFSYSFHDGYDYAKKSKANYGDPQLASASGIATLHKDFWAQGNAIYIDHGNRFQTRYYHLDKKDLVTDETNKKISVKQGQMIGRIGFTGNVDPSGEGGAHIHFMVVYDKNDDGNFDDNIPDGLTDPYGWMGGAGRDPWESATYEYPRGTNRTGMRSSYLWKYDLMDESTDIGPDGGVLAGDGIKIEVPSISLDQILNFHMKAVPQPKTSTQSADLEVIGSVTEITAKNTEGIFVRYFNNPFNIIIDLTTDVAKHYKPSSIGIYSSSDGGDTWQKENTTIDPDEGKAKAEVHHLTLFTLMGEKRDTLPPETSIKAIGLGKGNLFRSDVTIAIESADNTDGVGVEYTLFTLDIDSDWTEYMGEIIVASEGAHMIKAFAADKSGNIESPKVLRFVIDNTTPEINIRYATSSGEFEFLSQENSQILSSGPALLQDDVSEVKVEDGAGNTHELQYQESSDNDLRSLKVVGGKRNGKTINYKPSVYAISTSEGYVEFFRSGDEVTRVIHSVNGEKIMISSKGDISVYTGTSPLQLETDNDILKIK